MKYAVFGQLLNSSLWRYCATYDLDMHRALARAARDADHHGMKFAGFQAVKVDPASDYLTRLKQAAEQLGTVSMRLDDGAQVIRVTFLPGTRRFECHLNNMPVPEYTAANLLR